MKDEKAKELIRRINEIQGAKATEEGNCIHVSYRLKTQDYIEIDTLFNSITVKGKVAIYNQVEEIFTAVLYGD